MRNGQALVVVSAASLVVQVSGSRDWTDRGAVRGFLDGLHGSGLGPVDVVVSGSTRDVDAMAATWAQDHGVRLGGFHTKWDRLAWTVVSEVLDEYRLRADAGTDLGKEVG